MTPSAQTQSIKSGTEIIQCIETNPAMMEDDLLKYLGGDPRLEEKPTSQVHSPEYVGNYFANLYIRRLLLHHNFTQPNAALMPNAQCCSFTTNKLAKKSRKNIGLMSKEYISTKKFFPLL